MLDAASLLMPPQFGKRCKRRLGCIQETILNHLLNVVTAPIDNSNNGTNYTEVLSLDNLWDSITGQCGYGNTEVAKGSSNETGNFVVILTIQYNPLYLHQKQEKIKQNKIKNKISRYKKAALLLIAMPTRQPLDGREFKITLMTLITKLYLYHNV
ncbi:hypothetical protein JYU34_022367 [Plutella xylostella]|uniref:Uncharacterized protein n=1 Tax=Plutella xylostella TaxID=51655 RepID=A0ABQ7PQT8_PLUXY|nr:hypothetical protein JYU34_022367 [Plutella xylostella]